MTYLWGFMILQKKFKSDKMVLVMYMVRVMTLQKGYIWGNKTMFMTCLEEFITL